MKTVLSSLIIIISALLFLQPPTNDNTDLPPPKNIIKVEPVIENDTIVDSLYLEHIKDYEKKIQKNVKYLELYE